VLWVADSEVSAVRRIDVRRGVVQTLVGVDLFEFGDVDGVGDQVRLQHPLGVAWWESPEGGRVLIADSYNSKLKVLDPERRTVQSLRLGDHEFNEPAGVAVAGHRAFVADTNHHRVAIVDLLEGSASTLNLS
jgi:DNA-binding beta-propeller fold protein YncE